MKNSINFFYNLKKIVDKKSKLNMSTRYAKL